jgi:hypothetical protein
MAQLISKQMLVVVHLWRVAERPERPVALTQEILNPPSDQDPNEVIVESPPRLVTTGDGALDEANRLVDDRCHERDRATVVVARHQEGYFRSREYRRPTGRPYGQLGFGHGGTATMLDLQYLIESARRVGYLLTPDSGSRRFPEVGPQRLAPVAAQIITMIDWKEQHPTAQTIPRKHTQKPLIEINPQRSPR